MQLSSSFTFISFAAIAAAAKSFNLLVIRSGSDVQYNNIVADDGSLYLRTGSESTTFILTDQLALYDESSKKYVTVQDCNFVETDNPDHSFGTWEDHLTYQDIGFYYAGDPRKLTTAGDESIALRMINICDVDNPEPNPPEHKIQFHVVALRSGTKFENGAVKKVDAHPHVFSVGGDEGKDLILTLSPDGTMVDQDGRGVYYDGNTGELGNVDPWGQQQPSNGFAIKNEELFHDDKDAWKACPSGPSQYSLADNDCTGGTPIDLKVVDPQEV